MPVGRAVQGTGHLWLCHLGPRDPRAPPLVTGTWSHLSLSGLWLSQGRGKRQVQKPWEDLGQKCTFKLGLAFPLNFLASNVPAFPVISSPPVRSASNMLKGKDFLFAPQSPLTQKACRCARAHVTQEAAQQPRAPLLGKASSRGRLGGVRDPGFQELSLGSLTHQPGSRDPHVVRVAQAGHPLPSASLGAGPCQAEGPVTGSNGSPGSRSQTVSRETPSHTGSQPASV